MTIASIQFDPNFDWGTEEGQLMNLLLNMMGGLQYDDLSVSEKELLAKHGYPEEDPTDALP